jgi:hypothetical protein
MGDLKNASAVEHMARSLRPPGSVRAFRAFVRSLLVLGALALFTGHCGGSSRSADGALGDAGLCEGNGAGEYCSPSRGYCSSIEGFYCTTSKDTCVDPTTDCACGGPQPTACVYVPQVSHWLCGSAICAG